MVVDRALIRKRGVTQRCLFGEMSKRLGQPRPLQCTCVRGEEEDGGEEDKGERRGGGQEGEGEEDRGARRGGGQEERKTEERGKE